MSETNPQFTNSLLFFHAGYCDIESRMSLFRLWKENEYNAVHYSAELNMREPWQIEDTIRFAIFSFMYKVPLSLWYYIGQHLSGVMIYYNFPIKLMGMVCIINNHLLQKPDKPMGHHIDWQSGDVVEILRAFPNLPLLFIQIYEDDDPVVYPLYKILEEYTIKQLPKDTFRKALSKDELDDNLIPLVAEFVQKLRKPKLDE